MKVTDTLRAALLALGIMVVNVAISFVVVAVYSIAVAPGHDDAFYEAAAQRIAPWSSVVFGAPLFFAVAYWNARREPVRRGLPFAACMVVFYGLVDVFAVVAASAELDSRSALLNIVALSLGSKLIGALGGAWWATARARRG